MALTLAVSAVFLVELFSSAGMLSALSRREPSDVDWRTMHDEFRLAVSADPLTPRRIAVDQLMRWLGAARAGRVGLDQAAATASDYLRADSDNLVSRLCCGVIGDMQATADPIAGPGAIERFDKLSTVVAGPTPAKATTLYNRELVKQWYAVLSRRLARRDVAAAYAQYVQPVEISGYAVGTVEAPVTLLQFIHDRFDALAADLSAADRDDAAKTCRRWLARFTLGLIENEPAPATRLLGAELLAGTCGAESPAAVALGQLRADYRAAVERSPIDLSDGRPAVDPSAYDRALLSLTTSVAFALPAIGAAASLGLAGIVGMVVGLIGRLRDSFRPPYVKRATAARERHVARPAANRLSTPIGPPPVRRRWQRVLARLVLACLPAAVLAVSAAVNVAKYGCYSPVWVVVAAASGLAAGVGTACLLASAWPAVGVFRGYWRIVADAALMVLALLPNILPAPIVTRLLRGVDVAVGVLPVAVAGTIVLGLAGLLISRTSLRTLAAAALIAWCVNIVGAFAIYQFHRAADRTYQQSAATGRLDEFPARLGADWQDKYLGPVRRALAENPE